MTCFDFECTYTMLKQYKDSPFLYAWLFKTRQFHYSLSIICLVLYRPRVNVQRRDVIKYREDKSLSQMQDKEFHLK